MNRLLIGLMTLLLMSRITFAAQPLGDRQMDVVTAGFSATATAGAESFGGVTSASTATLAEVGVLTDSSGAPAGTTSPATTSPIAINDANAFVTIKSVGWLSPPSNLPSF